MLFVTEHVDLVFKDSQFIGRKMRKIQNSFAMYTVSNLSNFACLVLRLRNLNMLVILSNFVAVTWHLFSHRLNELRLK
jgi:hypothetical protein